MNEPPTREDNAEPPSHGPRPRSTDTPFDGELRLVLEAIDAGDWPVVAARTGIVPGREGPQVLSLFLELSTKAEAGTLRSTLGRLGLEVEPFWYREIERRAFGPEPLSIVPARLALAKGDPTRIASGESLMEQLGRIAGDPSVRNVRLATTHPRCLRQSLLALDWPTKNGAPHPTLRGKGIVIGIVDEGCAFAHHEFVVRKGRKYRTRVLCLWDQSRPPTAAEQGLGWSAANVSYGREIANAALDDAIAAHTNGNRIDEAAVYAHLNYPLAPPGDNATHGTLVMSIAAGDGTSLMGDRGVAPAADLIFVHLPPVEVDGNAAVLGDRIVDAAAYVFERAEALGKKAAVVNISYGGYRGAHDGTTAAELALDTLLGVENRAIVVSAGNGFDADCHADKVVPALSDLDIDWIVSAADPTENHLELWYEGAAALAVTLVSPDGTALGPFNFVTAFPLKINNRRIGQIDHVEHDPRNGDNVALVNLRPTDPLLALPGSAPAPPGTWKLRLTNASAAGVRVHAWIHRDDGGGPAGRRQQSRFLRSHAHPGCTIGDLASGQRTIAVGAYNVHTSEVCRYSSCGPTRESGGSKATRKKPEICAPAAEDAADRGVLAAASGRGTPRRLNGTSAAAPHVTGLIALVYDFVRNQKNKDLDITTLRNALVGQVQSDLSENLYIKADPSRPVKQKQVLKDLVGRGRASLARTLTNLGWPP